MQGTGRQLDERLAKALSHPLRQRILQRLNEGGVRSPNELSRELGDPLGNVSYHVRILRELDCVELVRTEQRRGALEHYYQATAEPWLDDEQWARLPAAFRRKTLGRTLSEILEGASAASRETGFDHPGGQGRPHRARARRRGVARGREAAQRHARGGAADPVRERSPAGGARYERWRTHSYRAWHPALPPRRAPLRTKVLLLNLRAPDHHDLPSRRMTKTALRWTCSSSHSSSTAPGR